MTHAFTCLLHRHRDTSMNKPPVNKPPVNKLVSGKNIVSGNKFVPGKQAMSDVLVRSCALLQGCALALLVCTATVRADDTEVFFGQVDLTEDNRPNLLFVLDTSGSMTWYGDSSETRIDRLKDAMTEIVDSSKNVNIGLMRFNGAFAGASVLYPLTSVDKVICQHAFCDEDSTHSQAGTAAADAIEHVDTGVVTLEDFALTMGADVAGESLLGLSFEDLDIPQGANIISARIEFVAEVTNSDQTILNIHVENTDDATPFTANTNDISDRNVLGKTVRWTPEPWVLNSVYETPELKSLVQLTTDRPGWCSQNTLNMQIEGTGLRIAQSSRRGINVAPKLKVTYDGTTIPVGGGCLRKTTTAYVETDLDDSAQFTNDSTALKGSSYPQLNYSRLPIWIPGYIWTTGYRFTDLDVPQGVVVEEAYITLKAASGSGIEDVTVQIEAENSVSPSQFSQDNWDISNRSTTGTVLWDLPISAPGDLVKSANVASLVQSIIDKGSWAPDREIALLIRKHSGSTNTFRAFETRESGFSPSLTVKYRTAVDASVNRIIKDDLKQEIANLDAHHGTPIVDALYEASQYMTGAPVHFGKQRGFEGNLWYNWDTEEWSAPEPQPGGGDWQEYGVYDYRSRYHRISTPASWTGGTVSTTDGGYCPPGDPSNSNCRTEAISGSPVYASPMIESCQTNHVVLLSDGDPTSNISGRLIESLTGESCFGNGPAAEQCGTELVKWMHDTDFNSKVDKVQGIKTYTVGFDLEDNPDATDFLTGLSTAGGGKHFNAKSTKDLVETFNEIISAVTTVDTAFVSPGATVNQFNRLTHRDDIYFALFKPSERTQWLGNLKRYKVADEGDNIVILDVDGNKAVKEGKGFFDEESQSFWSASPDGADVSLGGLAKSLSLTTDPGGQNRKVYTYTGTLPVSSPVDLTAGKHELSEDNNKITDEMLGIDGRDGSDDENEEYREDLLKWARGVDVRDVDGDGHTDDVRQEMGDPMHSHPVILNYGDSAESNETTVFIGTNQGFLHAIDPEIKSGPDAPDTAIGVQELFAWMPQELLDNIEPYYENKITQVHTYGLDGSMSVWIDDKDNDLTVDSDETAYLFVGMRRGGNSYYALDVSDREKPKLAWAIQGGADGTIGFSRLGQTWSRPIPTRVFLNGEEREVVLFSGGYSLNQDPKQIETDPSSIRYGRLPARTEDNEGEGIYMVDIPTGQLLWSGLKQEGMQTFEDMNYSMPASPEVIDVDLDGFADQIYAADAGGQVWRFDITSFHRFGDTRPFVQGGVMARLGGSADSEQRRFYHEPDVSLIEQDGKRFVSVSIGSGWRAHPLNQDINDRFYVLRSDSVYSKPDGYGKFNETTSLWEPVTDADLTDADDLSLDVDVAGHGWFKTLDASGEKVLASSITVNNQVAFTTYQPEASAELCSPAIGSGSVYLLDIVSGHTVADLDEDGDIDQNDDSYKLKHPGLPPPIVPIITENNENGLAGPEEVDLDFGMMTQRTFWSDLSDSPDNANMADMIED